MAREFLFAFINQLHWINSLQSLSSCPCVLPEQENLGTTQKIPPTAITWFKFLKVIQGMTLRRAEIEELI